MSPARHAAITNKLTAWLGWLQDFKKEQRYIGRYSVEKLYAFHDYQENTSICRVIAVIVLTPLPTILVLCGLDCIPLPDPRGGAKRNTTTFLRSILSHAIMTYACLLCAKQAGGLTERNTKYTHGKVALISVCIAVVLEAFWLIWAFEWRYPIPCREFIGVTPWTIITVLFNYIFAKADLTRVWRRLKQYIPVVSAQIVVFYVLLVLSIGFALVPWWAQIAMIFLFPLIKLCVKRALWKYARNLHDLSADVTICMVEISGSLYQTVCMNYVHSKLMVILLMALDLVQVAHETHLYIRHDYILDSKSTLQTAVGIIESALGSDARVDSDDKGQPRSSGSRSEGSRSGNPAQVQPVKAREPVRNATHRPESIKGSFSYVVARILSKGTHWHRRRRSQSSRSERYTVEPDASDASSVRPGTRRKSMHARKKPFKRFSSRAVLPALGANKSDMLSPRTNREEDSDDERLFKHRGVEMHGASSVSVDGIFIHRREQARILEQTLQLLFGAEVLLFVEYVEMFVPVLYSALIGGLWNLPNATYNVILMNMSYDTMIREVVTSLGYGSLEVVSFVLVYFFLKKRYGISALYQLAFLLESYAMTLQGKLVATFIIIMNSTTIHQGIDPTFKFDWDALLKTPNPYRDA
ncbi:hypothetical protein PF008_g4848 [Phytophthora fragariae]|uniref:Uncharacterized protein n=2 Tax=Phytophthora fragariae TaxID=53985 RepID=A0A6G0SA16_9STRA|nr:hypothetical protein PF008_g4848 [Phytophthora fragariae]